MRAVRCTVRGLFAMQCAARGLVAFARIVCLRAVWLHSRGALRCTGCDARAGALRAGFVCRRGRCHAFDHGQSYSIESEALRGCLGWVSEEWADRWAERCV